ncbi:DEAD/DEAH box helicase family protein, partial [uncultured Lamprocystis sp.]|uniref:type I restriction endonuclease subunit R, EcoR124 family n=1 Tax=uncultured Lamprocystis sp. TaxID=543132 RepID=UPI0025F27B1D
LDRQTREEFNKFQEGCVEENTNTETLVRRLLSDDYADKVIVTTIQKLGLALDGTNKRNYKERLEPLRRQRMVFIFDECHRSQFGENHQAIKEFFPKAQLFGFTGTPIFEQNASYQQIEGQQASYRTTADIFQQQLHAYTITHAIEDRNVLRFHVDYYKADGKKQPQPGEALKSIIADYNAQYGTNHSIGEFDLYYQDVQKRIKDQQYPNADLPHAQKIDITLVVDMLLIWLVDKAPVVIDKLQAAVQNLSDFMQSQGLANTPDAVPKLKGDAARGQFINLFKEVQRLKTQLDQYTDLTDDNRQAIEQILPKDQLLGFKGVYLDTAQRLKAKQDKGGEKSDPPTLEMVQQLDFEFVLFASSLIDYDYIMALITRYAGQAPGKQKMSRAELIGLIHSDAKLIDDRDALTDYIDSLDTSKPHTVEGVREQYAQYKVAKTAQAITDLAKRHGLSAAALQGFVDAILRRMIFDGELLNDLLAPLELGWKARTKAELALMEDLIPLLHKLAQGREISGLVAYES